MMGGWEFCLDGILVGWTFFLWFNGDIVCKQLNKQINMNIYIYIYVLEFVLWLMLKEARGNGEDYLDCIVQLMRMFLLIVHYVVLYKYYLG